MRVNNPYRLEKVMEKARYTVLRLTKIFSFPSFNLSILHPIGVD